MSIELNLLGSTTLDLSKSPDFLKYYNNPNSYSKHIIDFEINNGHYNDDDFLNIFKNNDAVVIDAGANIGLFSLYLHKACKKIYAIEPTDEHANTLKSICKDNNITNISTHQIAFNNYNGFCSFAVDDSNTTTNRIADQGNLVKCSRIYDFLISLGEEKIDLLKLDIEGGELPSVLQDPTFDKCAELCNNIYIEIHPPFCYPQQFVDKFNSMGYKVKALNSEHLNNNLNLLAFK